MVNLKPVLCNSKLAVALLFLSNQTYETPHTIVEPHFYQDTLFVIVLCFLLILFILGLLDYLYLSVILEAIVQIITD